jgi:hypothetical protein
MYPKRVDTAYKCLISIYELSALINICLKLCSRTFVPMLLSTIGVDRAVLCTCLMLE